MKCKHEGKKNFAVSKNSEYQHEYCSNCGWHKYKGKEYTKREWYIAFIKEEAKKGLK